MAKVKATSSPGSARKMPPALTPEADEAQMISLAMDLVRQRLIDGTASSQETTHFLKLASPKYRLEREQMEENVKLTRAKTEQIYSSKRTEELIDNALKAMKSYQGYGEPEDYEEY